MGLCNEQKLCCERILRPGSGQRKYEERCVANVSTPGWQILALSLG
jgi:hypothetical protein